jgi:putative tryptophan/tyrosine transport system substrate-binding protein
MQRREFIAGLGSTAACSAVAGAQQPERMRRIGVLLPVVADNAELRPRFLAFAQAMALLGWTIGHNVRIEDRWATPNAAEIRKHAEELATLAPDVILVSGPAPAGALLQATRTVPIGFVSAVDPVGAGREAP